MNYKSTNNPIKKTDKTIMESSEITPMMAQYKSIKDNHQDNLLFYRMGDFYEMFFEDAIAASNTLGITLTKRGKYQGEDIPMCGVPVHASEGYLARLIKNGFRVAICEQVENPEEAKKRGYKAVVKREVIRVVTPATITEEALLDSRSANYLAAFCQIEKTIGLAWCDISTGKFYTLNLSESSIETELERIRPGEILISESLYSKYLSSENLAEYRDVIVSTPENYFNIKKAEHRLCEAFRVSSSSAFGVFSELEISSAAAIIEYLNITQKGILPRLIFPNSMNSDETMSIDVSTRRNLEIMESLSGEKGSSLFDIIDLTVTGPGSRALCDRLSAPLKNPKIISDRLDAVAWFINSETVRDRLRQILASIPDLARVLGRITTYRSGPRDLAAIRDGLAIIPILRDIFSNYSFENEVPKEINNLLKDLGEHSELVNLLTKALIETPPVISREGNFVRLGYDKKLDHLVALRDEGRKLMAELAERYRNDTGITSLKIKHNNVLGYFIEVTSGKTEQLGDSFIHRQTLTNSSRYTTIELSDLEQNIVTASEKALANELYIFDELIKKVITNADSIAVAGDALANLDLSAALALLARERNYSRPIIDDTLEFDIRHGRHPVVEFLGNIETGFISNNCKLADSEKLWLLTGPNMAGKSTFLRQNALISILAQMGSYVPAEYAHIGVIDKLFSRVGAADDLARGRSTFMVEMIETAAILNQATKRSLVILDEIGRGTATFDGLSIAWATVEHLHNVNSCRALFATHYHELTKLNEQLTSLSCQTMRVKEWKGEVVFLHEVTAGTADRSYGIHVARLAGLPDTVIARAKEVLTLVESGEENNLIRNIGKGLPLFSNITDENSGVPSESNAEENFEDQIKSLLANVKPDNLTPREALDLIYKLCSIL